MGEGERELIKREKGLGSHLCFQKISSWVLREGLWVREKGTSWSYLGGGQNVRGGAWPWAVEMETDRGGIRAYFGARAIPL